MGPESSGKTTTDPDIIAEAQKKGGNVRHRGCGAAFRPLCPRSWVRHRQPAEYRSPNMASRGLEIADRRSLSGAIDRWSSSTPLPRCAKGGVGRPRWATVKWDFRQGSCRRHWRKLTATISKTIPLYLHNSCVKRSGSCSEIPRPRPVAITQVL